MTSKTFTEIHSQYQALKKTINLVSARKEECRKFFSDAKPDRIIVAGCGSSYQLSQAISMSVGIHLGLPSFAIPGGDLMLNMNQYMPLFDGRPMLVIVSRSGSTSEVLYTIQELKKSAINLSVFCIACTEKSPIAELADFSLEIPWAFDESVCQTRSVTNLYAAAMLAIAAVARDDTVFESYITLADNGEAYISSFEEDIQNLGQSEFTSVAVLADGEGAALADEAALAFNEIAYTPSTFKHVLDVRHGPIVLFDKNTVVILKIGKEHLDYHEALIDDIRKRGSRIIVVSDVELPPIADVSLQISFGFNLHSMASTAVVMPVAQLLSYYRAVAIHADPDQPDGLDAWIKL